VREADAAVGVPFVFAIAMGLRADDSVLAREVGGVLTRRAGDVRRILEEYGVPLVQDSLEAS
jgi:hypothetical protein